jgi:FkbM family methyltransferase
MLKTIAEDFVGLRRVCGTPVAMRWLAMIGLRAGKCFKTRTLAPADLSMGEGPFTARPTGRVGTEGGAVPVKLPGAYAIAGAREIWVRDVYLGGGHFKLEPGAVVVDLGANRGVFTARALAEQPAANVISVEPRRSDCERIRHMIRLNSFRDHVQICNAFLGAKTDWQERLLRDEAADYGGVSFLTEDEFIERYELTRIDFLKCDIEGSEYSLLNPSGRILAMTRQLAMELHDFAGDRHAFLDMLRHQGMRVVVYRDNPRDCIVHAWRDGGGG